MVDKLPPWPAFYSTVFRVSLHYLFTPWEGLGFLLPVLPEENLQG